MDRRSGMWRRKSSEKSSAESESWGSVSSYSERFSDEQGVFRSSPTQGSPNHAHSPEVSLINEGNEEDDTVKSLTEKLSAALLDVAAKERLVKQHAKVTEEAISGWESAEAEVAALKRQLDTCSLKNSVLDDRASHLDEALKECLRQLRQSREQQEQMVRNALAKARESESNKSKLEAQVKELYEQLETAKAEGFVTTDKSSFSRLESLDKENKSLKAELLAQSEQLRICMIEGDLSTRAAESASKQHLESIKKVARLEAECRRLQSVESSTSSSFQMPLSKAVSGAYNEQENLNSWASALIAELDQFKQEKASASDITAMTEIDLMDDFLEMERLVATPETDHGLSNNNLESTNSATEKSLRNELEARHLQVSELEVKIKKMETEKAQVKVALAETQNQLEASCNQLALAGDELVDLQRHLCLANESKQFTIAKAVSLEEERKETEYQLEMMHSEVMKLVERVDLLQGQLDENVLSKELEKQIEILEATGKEFQSRLNSAFVKADDLQEQMGLLKEKIEEERALRAVYLTKAEANEAAREELEIQLISAKSELENSNHTIRVLEAEVKEERLLSAKLAHRAEIAEAATSSLESRLKAAHSEAEKLHTEIRCLQVKVEEEMALGVESSAKCQVLEKELARRKKDAELLHATNSNGNAKFNKEKELAEAAGKLAECQKTIASLGRQLKSLSNIDEFIFEATNPGSDGHLPYLSFSETKTLHPNGSEDSGWSLPPLSSSASALPGLARLLSRSRSCDHVGNP